MLGRVEKRGARQLLLSMALSFREEIYTNAANAEQKKKKTVKNKLFNRM